MNPQKKVALSTGCSQLIRTLFRVFIILNTLLLLSSCIFSQNTAPSIDLSRSSTPNRTNATHHIVKSGETLYSIAWRYGLDYRLLAKANGVDSKFLIYTGQRLILSDKPSSVSAVSHRGETKKVASVNSSVSPASKKIPAKSNNVPRVSTKKAHVAPKPVARSKNKSSSIAAVTKSKSSSDKVIWRWPINGLVITNFSTSANANKGIDIKGKKGDSVRAAASGTIVYAGSGLRGYGQLIIIKHNSIYLSAYAHNDKIYIKEGQKIKAGQHIADIGSSGSRTDTVKLHFEIRRNGQPVNPLTYLPKR